MKKLPDVLKLSIYEFLKSEELFFIPLICFSSSELIKNNQSIYRKHLENQFSEYFQADEIKSLNIKDVRSILLIMMMHRRFTSRIHLHDTPYYDSLINQTLNTFLTVKQQSIEDFPWAAVIMGNLMRVQKRMEAAKYFKMAIQLPIAKTFMALTYNTQELKDMKLIETMKDSEQWYPKHFRVYDDFIIYHLKKVAKYFPNQHLLNMHTRGSEAHFKLLENNFMYCHLLGHWQEFKVLPMNKFQYINSWHIQMNQEKDPVLASHRAAGLVQLYFLKHLFAESTELLKNIDERIEDCIQKGGFDLGFKHQYQDQDQDQGKFNSILSNICQSKIPVRPGLLGLCFTEVAYLLIQELDLIEPEQIHEVKIQILSLLWKAIVDGFPEAVLWFNHFVDETIPSLDVLRSHSNLDFIESPFDDFSLGLIFRIFFVAQQSVKWIANFYSNAWAIPTLDKAKDNLAEYTKHENDYVSASANMALGLLCAEEQDEKKSELHFQQAKEKDISASVDYLGFAKRHGYRVPFFAADNKQFLSISQWAKSNPSIGDTSLKYC